MTSGFRSGQGRRVAASAAFSLVLGCGVMAEAQRLQSQQGGGAAGAISPGFQADRPPPRDTPVTVPSTPQVTGPMPGAVTGDGNRNRGGGDPAEPAVQTVDDPRGNTPGQQTGGSGSDGGRGVDGPAPVAPARGTTRSTWQLCNGTGGGPISVAIGHPQGGDWVSRGWINIADGACRTIFEATETPRVYYFAMSARRTYQGQAAFCIRRGAGFAHAGRVCRDGHQAVRFRAVTLDRAAVRTTVR